MTKTELITRPRLASFLMQRGFEGVRTINPFNPKRVAWEFESTPSMLSARQEYFNKLRGGV